MERADVMIMRMISPTAMLTICRLIDCRIIVTPGERYTHRLPPSAGTIIYTRTSTSGDPGRPEDFTPNFFKGAKTVLLCSYRRSRADLTAGAAVVRPSLGRAS